MCFFRVVSLHDEFLYRLTSCCTSLFPSDVFASAIKPWCKIVVGTRAIKTKACINRSCAANGLELPEHLYCHREDCT